MVRAVFDASALVQTLKNAEKKMPGRLREAMDISVRDVQERARKNHRFVTRTGEAEASIETSVDVNGGHLTGIVYTALPHAVFLHQGTRSHTVVPRTKMALRWSDGGSFVFAKRSQVAGIQGDPYLYNALADERASIVSRFEAIGGLLKG